MAEAVARKPIDVTVQTKERGLKAIAEHFPPGTAAWAVWDAWVKQSLDDFLAGKREVFGVSVKANGKATANSG